MDGTAPPAAAPETQTREATVVPDEAQRIEMAIDEIGKKLPEGGLDRLKELKKLRDEHKKVEQEYHREWNELKLRYLQRFRPIYENRHKMLSGGQPADQLPTVGTPNIPGFWLTALSNHYMIAQMIEERDKEILQCLDDVRFEWLDEKQQTSFRVIFEFVPNKFFEPNVLVKTYHLEVSDSEDENVLTKTEGTEIRWKEGMDVTKKTVSRKQKNKRTHQTRIIQETVDAESFFNFFQSHEIPSEEQLERMNDQEVGSLEAVVEAEFEVGCILRDKILPRLFGWYLGIEKDDDIDSDEDEDSESGSEDDEGDDSAAAENAPNGQNAQNPECNTQ